MHQPNVEAIYYLSPLQEGMLFHSLYTPQSSVYIEQKQVVLHGSLNTTAFQQAWQNAIDHYPVLRTCFIWELRDKPVQVVRQNVQLAWQFHDWRGLSSEEQQTRLQTYLETDRQLDFELAKAPPIRFTLIQLQEEEFFFLWTNHHILIDAWSGNIIFAAVGRWYDALCQGKDLHLTASRPYRDYISWLQQQEKDETAEKAWRKELAGFTSPTQIAGMKRSTDMHKRKLSNMDVQLTIDTVATTELRTFARQQRITLNTLVQGAWACLLSCSSGQRDIVFGTTVSVRPTALDGVESMVGLFINTIPVRIQLPTNTSITHWLAGIQEQQAAIQQYNYCSLVDMQAWSEIEPGQSLFESLLVFENVPTSEERSIWNKYLSITKDTFEINLNYPLTVVVIPGPELVVQIKYDNTRFQADTITHIMYQFQLLLQEMTKKGTQSLSTLSWLTDAEKRQILIEWNSTSHVYPTNRCIHQLYEMQTECVPDAIAIVYEQEHITYRQLNQRANHVAHHLQKVGVGPEVPVALYTHRSPDTIVGALAIWKAGGAYIPIDPLQPKERIAFILEDARTTVVLTHSALNNTLPVSQATVLCLNTLQDISMQESMENSSAVVNVQNIAYAIYTSGSTGKPKGVQVEHHSLLNLVYWHLQTFAVSAQDRATQMAGLSFDASIWEIWPYLAAGASVHLLNDQQKVTADELQTWLITQAITVSFLPTPLAEQILTLTWDQNLPLRLLLTGGDVLHPYPQAHLPFAVINNYGPTENTVVATSAPVPPQNSTYLPAIGRPIYNNQIYLLDTDMRPVPIEVVGELYIGGHSVARAYLHKPELTAERFLPDPFSALPGARLYRSGDLARYLPDGAIAFIGRADHQVKLRGYRIELGEIEAVIKQYTEVQDAVVLLREDIPGESRLVAYIVHSSQNFSLSMLRDFLKQYLPEYMLPTFFVVLDSLPLSNQGKIDRRALRAPLQSDYELQTDYVAPRTETEVTIAAIWSEILGLERISIHDNFFNKGGHSILATRVISRIRKTLNIELPLYSIFEMPTVAEFATGLKQLETEAQAPTAAPIVARSRDAYRITLSSKVRGQE